MIFFIVDVRAKYGIMNKSQLFLGAPHRTNGRVRSPCLKIHQLVLPAFSVLKPWHELRLQAVAVPRQFALYQKRVCKLDCKSMEISERDLLVIYMDQGFSEKGDYCKETPWISEKVGYSEKN